MRHVGDSVAHDLRGPITRLRNRLETVAAAEHPSRDDLADCVAQLDQVLATFNALLRIARVESGAYRSAFTTVDLKPIVRDVCELYQAAAEERQVTLRGEPHESVEVYGDRELLAQVLTNLVDNAVKYTPPGGAVRIELARSGDTCATARRGHAAPAFRPTIAAACCSVSHGSIARARNPATGSGSRSSTLSRCSITAGSRSATTHRASSSPSSCRR